MRGTNGKRVRSRLGAGCLALILAGCSGMHVGYVPLPPDQARFRSAEEALSREEYENALSLYADLIRTYPDSRYTDEAQFKIGFTYVCYRNPAANYAKALEAFRTVVQNYPQSIWLYEARNWIAVLESLQKFRLQAAQAATPKVASADPAEVKELENRVRELEAAVKALTEEKSALLGENQKLRSVLKKLEAIDRE